MGDVINLRQARKAAKRAGDARDAAANRLRFGRTKGQKAADVLEARRAAAAIDGARLERKDDE